MAVAWIQWNDQRRPPPTLSVDQVGINVPRDDPEERDSYSLRIDHDEEEDMDEDKPLYSPPAKDVLSRNSSLGKSWGVTSVGRGFDWRKKSEPTTQETTVGDKAPELVEISTSHSAQDKESIASNQQPAATAVLDLAEDLDSRSIAANEGNPKSLIRPASPIAVPYRRSPSPPLDHPEPSSSLEMSQQTSPFTPSLSPSPASPFAVLATTSSGPASPRPIVAGRSQSMYVVPSALSMTDDRVPQRSANASPAMQAQRARAWSRPVSPARSPSMPTLITSPSAPSLNGGVFGPLTPLIMTGGALTTPNTPRSPRLNRSR